METLVNPSFWPGRRVFVTGHTGFKGGWLCLMLQNLGAEVTGYALPPETTPNLYDLADIGGHLTSVIGDIRDAAALKAALLASRAEIVIHMAAQPLVRRSYREPTETFATNVMGAINLFEAVRASDTVRAVINVTSDKCYRPHAIAKAHTEDDAMGGHDPYSASKGCAELVTESWRHSFLGPQGIAVATGRAGNVIGGGDWAEDRLVPDLMRALVTGETVSIRSPGAIRPWQHVVEPVTGYLMLAEQLIRDGQDFAQGWNFGPDADDAKPVGWIVDHMAKLSESRLNVTGTDQPQPPELATLLLDNNLARTRLGWVPRLPLAKALDWTFEWYNTVAAHPEAARAVTLDQIRRYGAEGTLQ